MKLSIITVNYNDAKGLANTIASVRAQTIRDFEYIVVDGGSKDESLEIIKSSSDIITHWISEPDKGIYNAMNKGVKMASGEFVQFLNAGDVFYNEKVISRVIPRLKDKDFYNGHCYRGKWDRLAPKRITVKQLSCFPLEHQATFIRTSLLKKRPYDESFSIVSDWEQMFFELIVHEATYERLNFHIALFDVNGVSSVNLLLCEKEVNMTYNRYFSKEIQGVVFSEGEIDATLMSQTKSLLAGERTKWRKMKLMWLYFKNFFLH